MTRKINVLDTTMRDGEQSPGASMNAQEKLVVARQLVRLGVDAIEAGFPMSSPGDFKSVQQIVRAVGDSCIVVAFARAIDKDIDCAAEALRGAKHPRIHLGLGVSDIHLSEKLHMTEDEALERVRQTVSRAKGYVDDVQFFAEDATRANIDTLVRFAQAAVDAGATVINIADTTGFSLPDEFGERVRAVRDGVRGIENVTISVHTHNDLGLATANALAGIRNGATQVECSVNGLGERAGNAAIEEVAMAIALHGDELDAHTDIATTEITRASRLVARVTGMSVQANKAIVGANAFTHSSGIHQDGVLKARETYEIIDPTSVGAAGSEILLSARSGHAALRHRLGELGHSFSDAEFEAIYERFLVIADQKKEVFDEDLESIVQERAREVASIWSLKALQVSCGDPLVPTATATLTDENGLEIVSCAYGTGPIDAAYKAIDQVVAVPCVLEEFSVKAITRGIDAIGEVTARVTAEDGRSFTGRGADNDIIVSSAKAYVNALNRMIETSREFSA